MRPHNNNKPTPTELLFADTHISITFGETTHDLSFRDLSSCFQEVFQQPAQWCKPIGGTTIVFDELPATKIDTKKFTLSFIANLALQITRNSPRESNLRDLGEDED
tara:strand:+ start:40 stop:357 length:318 start_codon:yes stop_codon:yes gene_type:complete